MQENLKIFLIKLVAITISIIVIINIVFNVLLGERLEKIDKIISLNDSKNRSEIKMKIRKELNRGLEKDQIFSDEDKVLIFKLYLKLREEFKDIDKKALDN
tara:strand:+ start:1216 stop:1518 length:303 start_codon:yes stop_codon:yes gene_type:complete